MSDSDDDYMSEKLLQECVKNDVRPSLLYSSTSKRNHEQFKRQEEVKKATKPKAVLEKELLEKGLSTPIDASNKGFKMLQKLGFQPGTSLGKKKDDGIKVPITIVPKNDLKGVGNKPVKRKVEERDTRQLADDFRAVKSKQINVKLDRIDLRKAQLACKNLDMQHDKEKEQSWFWPYEPKKKSEESDSDSDEEEEEEPTDEEIRERLVELSQYLRDAYFYCLWCGCAYPDQDQMESECPGNSRNDH